MSVTLLLVVLGCAAAVGAISQRLTGIGFALIVLPVGAIVLPQEFVVGTVTRLSVVVDVCVLAGSARDLDRQQLIPLVTSGVGAVPAGLVISRFLPVGILVTGGCMATLAAVAMAVLARRATAPRSMAVSTGNRQTGTVLVGFSSGVLGVTGGLCGPPLAVHGLLTRRPLATSRANLAAFFLVVDLVASLLHPRSAAVPMLIVPLMAIVTGVAVGARLVRRLDDHLVETIVLGLVIVCSTGAIIHSVW